MASDTSKAHKPIRLAWTVSSSGGLEVTLRDENDFCALYSPNAAGGSLRLHTRREAPLGTPVSVLVRLGRRQPPVHLVGRVGPTSAAIAGIVQVELAESERAKCDFLRARAREDADPANRRRHERLEVDVPVTWRSERGPWTQARLRDIGRGGAFVETDATTRRDQPIELEIASPGAILATALAARVAWSGRKPDLTPGFGVEFRARDAGGSRRIDELVRRLRGDAATSPSK